MENPTDYLEANAFLAEYAGDTDTARNKVGEMTTPEIQSMIGTCGRMRDICREELRKRDGPDVTGQPARVKPGWKMPEPPDEACGSCGKPLTDPVAVNTGGEWFLCWDCEDGCGYDGYEMIGVWPFVDAYAWVEDFEALGFTVV